MIGVFKYFSLLALCILIHGKEKEKRDISDLKDDPLLSSVFNSDIKEKRPDRSVSLQEELLAAQRDKSRKEQLTNILFPKKEEKRRDADPELMTLNNKVNTNSDNQNLLGTGIPGRTAKNVTPSHTIVNNIPGQTAPNNNGQVIPGQTVANINNNNNQQPIVSKQTPVVAPNAAQFHAPSQENDMMEQQVAVNPALFAANYLPLPGEKSPEQQTNTQVTRKDIIPKPELPVKQPSFKVPSKIIDKKSMIPMTMTVSDVIVPNQGSFPVQLRIHSPNARLRGIVPHVAEYGETVESIQQAQNEIEYRRNMIPQEQQIPQFGTYSNEVSKKNSIPHPESKDTGKSITPVKKSKVKTSKEKKTKEASKKSKTSSKKSKATTTKKSENKALERQFTPQAMSQPYGMNIANYQQQNPFSVQQSALQFKAQENAAQVQNMDGLMTRPIISEESCADQYSTCTDFAKNNYCTDYPDLMKIQCRKSCRYCTPPGSTLQNTTAQARDETEAAESGSGDYADAESGSGDAVTEDAKLVAKPTVSVVGSKRHDILQERHHDQSSDAESGSGITSESGSGNSESGAEESGSDSTDEESAVAAPSKVPMNPEHARNKIWHPRTIPKVDLGEFTLPVKKSAIPMAPVSNVAVTTNADSAEESGSGSGSGSESGDESGSESGDSATAVAPEKKTVTPKKAVIPETPANKPHQIKPTKKKLIPSKPSIPGAYPKIDLKAIANALAHYEEAALELAGEYPKPAAVDITDYTRSIIPHPVNPQEEKMNKFKQNIQIAKLLTDERVKKFNIPKYLRLTKDALKDKVDLTKEEGGADSLDSVRQRFDIPGLEPTLNDYYAETGKVNPFDKNTKTYKKSRIETEGKKKKKNRYMTDDPYEYLRNMPAGASMEPIVDPKTRSTIEDHSYPVFLMKVSPADKKYVAEEPSRRGVIRKLDAEGLLVTEEAKKPVIEQPPPVPVAAVIQKPQMPEYQAPQPVQFRQPHYPARQPVFEAPPAPDPEQAPIIPPWNANIEQATAPRASPAFAQEPVVMPEQQPGTDSLRSKMLSAFFNVKANSAYQGSGEGSGEGADFDAGTRQTIHWPGGFKK